MVTNEAESVLFTLIDRELCVGKEYLNKAKFIFITASHVKDFKEFGAVDRIECT